MIEWGDYRFFLAVAREASVKKAANVLGVNRSTVLRRIVRFEENQGVRLFERMPGGYFTTPAGDEMMKFAEKIEAVTNDVGRQIAGRDKQLSGTIRISLSGVLATYLLIPEFAKFSRSNPDIELQILDTYEILDLARREADVAIHISNDPPDDLVGRRVVKVARAAYIGADYYDGARRPGGKSTGHQPHHSWIGWSTDPSSLQWVEDSDFPDLPVGAVVTDPFATVKALEAGMGMSILPCYMGDSEPRLRRFPPGNVQWLTDLWVLTHKDLRNTARIRKITQCITETLIGKRDLVEGRRERP
jgi:DNA-binding transcriptional LysR family regulator